MRSIRLVRNATVFFANTNHGQRTRRSFKVEQSRLLVQILFALVVVCSGS